MADSSDDAQRLKAQDQTTQARSPSGTAAELVSVLDQYLEDLKAGKPPDKVQLLAAHPELAEQLETCLASLEFMHGASQGSGDTPAQLGDFQILAELGRGGMGVVYRARQLSLNREVALKVLRFGSATDPEAMQRFQTEAETVARLHHTNIVPIFAVGQERGVNYYAMQLIAGRGLDVVFREGDPHNNPTRQRGDSDTNPKRQRGEALDARIVAGWCLQAAEALAHAHGRGVIHRDVKPSNLLLDEQGVIWLTDFGLAKRADEVTMTVAGAILGTPRYMSPEQADNVARPVDHRTDVYSLGATLYELATGQPVFTADTPVGVIMQIIEAEPKAPRAVRPDLPRDLDTIIVKCLAKDPGTRYQSAKELADDLRAFVDGRPIAARRTSFVELAGRWLARQKKSVALTSIAVAATLALVLVGVVGGYAWHRSRLARVMLKTDRPPLLAEFSRLDLRSDQGGFVDASQVALSANLPMLEPLDLPADDYRLRLSQDKRLDQSLDVHLARGQTLHRMLNLEDQLLWGDLKLERTFRVATFAERTKAQAAEVPHTSIRSDLILLTDAGLQCLSGTNAAQRWQLALKSPVHPLIKDGLRIEWPWNIASANPISGVGQFDLRPWVVSARLDRHAQTGAVGNALRGVPGDANDAPSRLSRAGTARNATEGVPYSPTEGVPYSASAGSFDLNGDGTSDLVLAAQHQPWLIAMNGASGEPLWVAAREEATSAEDRQVRFYGRFGAVLYPPLVVGDQDGDGVDDLAVSFIYRSRQRPPVERWLELISGGSGKSLWRYDLPAELFAISAGEEAPADLRWYDGSSGGYSKMGVSGGDSGHYYTRSNQRLDRSGPHEYVFSRPTLLSAKLSESPRLSLVAGKQLASIDLKTGTAKTIDLTVRAGTEPRYGDFNGDGQTDLLLAEERKAGSDTLVRLSAWSPASQSVIWTRDLAALWPSQPERYLTAPAWPLVDDINGDGLCEVLVPDASSRSLPPLSSPPWGEISLLDGRTGEPRWTQRIRGMDQQVDRFVLGPDINGDRHREVYVAVIWGTRHRHDLFVDCLSGKDGQVLWRSKQSLFNPTTENADFYLAELSWHDDAGDGWPQLAVPARRDSGSAPERVYFFSAGTGRPTHVAQGISAFEPADFNADGTPDLLLFSRASANDWDLGGTLQALRGVGQEAWRAALPQQTVVGDLNADGVRDVIRSANDLVTTGASLGHEARCGRTGKLLWNRSLKQEWYWQDFFHPAAEHDPHSELLPRVHDLNGDGTPDLLFIKGPKTSSSRPQPLVTALSGRTGRMLWKSAAAVRSVEGISLVDCRDLDGDGQAEVVVVAASDWNRVETGIYPAKHLSLLVLSGTDGSVRWSAPLVESPESAPGYYNVQRMWLEAAYADLDGDGRFDIVLPAQHDATGWGLAMRAFSGLDGQPLWSFPLPLEKEAARSFANAPPAAAGDVDGDGRPEMTVASLATESSPQGEATFVRLELLDGATGEARWQWKTPADRWAHRIDERADDVRDRLRPVLLRRPGGKQWIALQSSSPLSHRELHVVNEQGQLVSQVRLGGSNWGRNSRPRALDADGDGCDELVVNDGNALVLLRADQLDRPLWRTRSTTTIAGVLGVLPESAPGRIVVSAVSEKQFWWQGVDVATGQEAWAIVGTTVNPISAGQALLNAPGPNLPPHALQQSGEVAFVRRGVSHDTATNEAWRAFSRDEPVMDAASRIDSRLLRPLPWLELGQFAPWREGTYLAWAGFYGLTLIALPVAYAAWIIRRRQWALRTLLLLPVVVGIFLLGVLINSPVGGMQPLAEKFTVALFWAAPFLFSGMMLVLWLRRKRWTPIAVFLGAGLVFGGACLLAAALNVHDVPMFKEGLLEGERWSWTGWPWIFPPAYHAVAWITLVVVPVVWLSKFTWRKCRRERTLAPG